MSLNLYPTTTQPNYYIPNFAYLFKEIQNEKKYYELLAKETHRNYLFSKTGFCHGGIHFNDSLPDVKATQGIRAIADGELVAFRINDTYLQNDDDKKTGKIKDLNKDTKLTLGTLNQYGRYNILQIDGKNQTGICTVDKGSVIPIEDALKLNTININTIANNEIQFPSQPIKIKAGEVIGLVGENNINHGTNREVLHLEVFVSDKEALSSFIQTARKNYNNTQNTNKPKPTQIKILSGKTIYDIKDQSIVNVTSTPPTATLRKGN